MNIKLLILVAWTRNELTFFYEPKAKRFPCRRKSDKKVYYRKMSMSGTDEKEAIWTGFVNILYGGFQPIIQ